MEEWQRARVGSQMGGGGPGWVAGGGRGPPPGGHLARAPIRPVTAKMLLVCQRDLRVPRNCAFPWACDGNFHVHAMVMFMGMQ